MDWSLSFKDGLNLLKNKNKKITEAFSSMKEGFGILGPSTIDSKNTVEAATTTGLTTSLNAKIDSYTTANDNLKQKTNTYLNSIANTEARNYNLFINKTVDYGDIVATPYTVKCATSAILSGAGMTDAGSSFSTAYPSNFTTVNEAKNACKLWAADAGAGYFALTKDPNNIDKYKCYTGDLTGNPSVYSVPQVAYTIASSTDATLGGLFSDGTFGIYNNLSGATNPADATNPKNIKLMQGLGGTVPTGYTLCDKWIGGSINVASVQASLARNCSGLTLPPFSTRYITITSNSNGDYIQIAQLAVYVYNDEDGTSKNVATRANNPDATITTNDGSWDWTNPYNAIDGNLSCKSYPYIHHSRNRGNITWILDLKKEYPVYQVVYFNRGDCCQYRANGMRLILQNGDKSKQVTKTMNGSYVQTFSITNP